MTTPDDYKILTAEDVRQRLPYVISVAAVRKQLKESGVAIVHRRQVVLLERDFPAFLESLKCSEKPKSSASQSVAKKVVEQHRQKLKATRLHTTLRAPIADNESEKHLKQISRLSPMRK